MQRGRRCGLFLLLLLAGAPLLAAAPVLALSAGRRDGRVAATLSFRWDKPDDLMKSLEDGLESRIVFTVRLYEKRTGLLSFRGDHLLAERTFVRRAYRDILTQRYIVVDEQGSPQQEYETAGTLLAGFLEVREVIFGGPLPAAGRIYVAARAVLEPVRLMPPLTLVALIGTAAAYATPWIRSDVP